MRLSARSVVVVGASAMGALVASCRDPTEIVLVLRTDVPCTRLTETSVSIGPAGALPAIPTAQSNACAANGELGTLVIVPSGARNDSVAIEVDAALDGHFVSECTPGAPACIRALREVRYVPHQSLTVPLTLELQCVGVSCGPDATCVHGACVSAALVGPGCDGPSCAPPPDGGPADATTEGATCAGADTQLDPRNCGACGHDCAGGACVAGACAAYTVASAGRAIGAFATDGARVYWTEIGDYSSANGAVRSAPRAGGVPTTVAAARESPLAIAVDDAFVYFTDLDTGLMRIAKDGSGQPQPLATAINLFTVAVDGGFLYWGSQNPHNGAVFRANKDGSGAATFATDTDGPFALTLGGSAVYWLHVPTALANAAVMALDSVGGVPRAVAPFTAHGTIDPLAATATSVAWADGHAVRVAKGGVVTTAATAGDTVTGIALDGDVVYFATASTTATAVSKVTASGEVVVLAKDVADSNVLLKADATLLYWATASVGQIRAIAK